MDNSDPTQEISFPVDETVRLGNGRPNGRRGFSESNFDQAEQRILDAYNIPPPVYRTRTLVENDESRSVPVYFTGPFKAGIYFGAGIISVFIGFPIIVWGLSKLLERIGII